MQGSPPELRGGACIVTQHWLCELLKGPLSARGSSLLFAFKAESYSSRDLRIIVVGRYILVTQSCRLFGSGTPQLRS